MTSFKLSSGQRSADKELVTKPPTPKTEAESQLMIEAGPRSAMQAMAAMQVLVLQHFWQTRLSQALKQNDNLMSVDSRP